MLAAENAQEGTRATNRTSLQAVYHRALRNAAKVLRLNDNIFATASTMICFIPKDANEPVSPVQVQRLADERNISARTVHNHIKTLIKLGLATDTTKDGGGRSLVRSSSGEIVALHGISFKPLLEQADDLEAKVAEINAIATEKTILRGQISTTRKKIRRLVQDHIELQQFENVLEDSPRRIGHFSIVKLNALHNHLVDLLDLISTIVMESQSMEETASFYQKESDQSEINDQRYNNTTERNFSLSNRDTIKTAKEHSRGRRQISPDDVRSECGLDHISLDHAMRAAPKDWHEMIDHYGTGGWAGFSNFAYQRGAAMGMNASAWKLAEDTIGRSGAALLVMIADANSEARGGDIRSPAGWVRSMANKATRGEAYIHRSVFGILNRSDTLQ